MFIFDFKEVDSREGITYYYYNIVQDDLKVGYVEITINHPMYGTAASVVIDKNYCKSTIEKDLKTLFYVQQFAEILKSNLIEFDELDDINNMYVCHGLEHPEYFMDKEEF